MTTIHRDASRFINVIAHLADHHYFPGTSVLQELPSQSIFSYLDLLPVDLQIQVYNQFVISNYSDWLRSSSVLEPPRLETDKESLRQRIITETARYQLAKLHLPLDPSLQPHQQLLKHIFQEAFFPVYSRRKPIPSLSEYVARNAQLEEALQLTSRLAPQSLEITALIADRSKYRVARVAFELLFNNLIGSLICWFVTYKIVRYAQLKLGHHFSRIATSFLKTHAPSIIILAERMDVAARHIITHYLNPTLNLLAKPMVGGKQYILLIPFIEGIENIGIALRFCVRGVFKPAFWVVIISGGIGNLLHLGILYLRNQHQQEYWQRGTDIARRIWIDLTTNGARAEVLQHIL